MIATVRGRLRALWAYRGFVLGMVVRDLQARYLGSVLGASWAVLNPLAQILIYTVVFSQVMRARLPGADDMLAYGFYLCAGLLTWTYFVEVVLRSQVVFLENATLLKKVSFPRVALPAYVFLSATTNFAITWGLFLALLLVLGRWPGWPLVAMLPLLLVQQTLAVSLGILFGVVNVFFRDVAQAVGVALQFWFWLTPIVYPIGALPDGVQRLVAWNPVYRIMAAYQDIVVAHRWPAWTTLWPVVAAAVVAAIACDVAFRRLADAMVDEL